MTKTFEEVPVATVEVIPTFDGNEIKFKPLSKLENYLIAEGEVELYLRTQHQPLPEVPECVGSFLTGKSIFEIADGDIPDDVISWVQEQTYYVYLEKIISHLISIKVTGYTVEKPQLFEVKMPIVYWDDDASQLTNGFEFLRIDKETDEVDFIGFLSNTKKHTVYFTEKEIKSIDERYWQFAVPVEDVE